MPHLFSDVNLTEPLTLRYLLTQFWHDIGDHRFDHYLLYRYGPLVSLAPIFVYLLLCKQVIPFVMRDREPILAIRPVLLAFNIVLCAANAYVCLKALIYLRFGARLIYLSEPDRSDRSPDTMRFVELNYFLLCLKYVDLAETVLLLAMKKRVNNYQICHHTVTPILGWLLGRVMAACVPMGIFFVCNSLLHAVRHVFYGLMAVRVSMDRLLWKRLIARLEIWQFMLYALYDIYCMFYLPGYPILVLVYGFVWPVFFTAYYFYIVNKINRKKRFEEHGENNNHNYGINSVIESVDKLKIMRRKAVID